MSEQRTALVTGASSGIGRATAAELARRGHHVIAAARRRENLDQLSREAPGVVPVTMDVCDPDSIQAGFEVIDSETGGRGVDALVNCAGYAVPGPVETIADSAVKGQFDTNVFGLLEVTRAALPAMRARGRGRVVNLSSVVGRTTFPGMGVYGASKFALEALSDALRMELAPFGVDVILIEPAFVRTEIIETSAREATEHAFEVGPYGKLMQRTGALLASEIAKGAAPEAVARVVADSIERRKPRSRYVVPARAGLMIRFLNALPDGAADSAKAKRLRSFDEPAATRS